MAERSRVSIRLTTEAHSGWDRACRIAGVTMTALIEAIGRDLEADPHRLLNRGSDVVDAAKAIDQERRNRR